MLGSILKYRRVFKDYMRVARNVYFNRYPFVAKFRSNGATIHIKNGNQAWLVSYGIFASFDDSNGLTKFPFQGRNLAFKGADSNGDLAAVYGKLKFENIKLFEETVVDVGANIGDSSIYFIARGAKRVIAIEPFPQSFNLLIENIRINGLGDKIIPLNLAIGKKLDEIRVDTGERDTTASRAKDYEGGSKVVVVPIGLIIDTYGLSNAILKINCEGCEYDLFETIKLNELSKFKQVFLEYHGSRKKNLVILRKMRDANFEVKLKKENKNDRYILFERNGASA